MWKEIAFISFFHITDLATGLVGAVRNKNIESAKLRDGMFKKVGFLFCYALSVVIDNYGYLIGMDIGVNTLPIVIGYALIVEIVSIAENIHKINPDLLPEKILQLLKFGGERNDDK